MFIKRNAQSTAEYLFLIGAVLIVVLAFISKGGMKKKIANVYDTAGNVMSDLGGKTNTAAWHQND